jgi:carnitine 3-dehydrogenase
MPSDLQRDMVAPERLIVGHPFNPVYLLPLVELVGGAKTGEAAIEAARKFYTHIGMHALRVRKEIPGHLTDRLQEALWREILHLVNDGVATTGELDESIIYGPGLRWAAMGTNQIYHLAGGEPGMRHMLHQFGPCLKWPWTKLEAPELTEQLIDRMVEGTSEQAGGRSIRELERLRDDYLVAIQQVLRQFNIGAGSTLKALETRLYNEAAARMPASTPGQPLKVFETAVRAEWIDYNGHLTDHRYLHVFGDAHDVLWRQVGINEDYRSSGHAFFTAESHIRHHAEVSQADTVHVTLQILGVDAKRLNVFSRMHRADGTLAATAEHMYLHVDTKAGKTAPMAPELLAKLEKIAAAQAGLPRPEDAGRAIGMKR